MSIRVDKVQLEIEVREHKRDAEIVKLNKELGEAGRKYRSLQNEVDKLNDKKTSGAQLTAKEASSLKTLETELERAKSDYQQLDRQKTEYVKNNKLETMTIYELSQEYRSYREILRNLDPNSDYYKKTQSYLDALKNRMSELNGRTIGTMTSLQKFAEGFNHFAFAITNTLAIKDRIVSFAEEYVNSFAKMDEAMTDVMKYTGQTKAEVEEMNETFKKMTTRTPREELNALAGAAGRLGITGKSDIEGFVDAADKINVALGDDLGEGAIDQIGKLTMVFGEDKTKGLNGAMLATGSAINELGASSSAATGFITDFTSEMAGMAVNAKISQTDIMGYASALSQSGVEGKTASGVFAQLITKMFTDPAKFAKAARLDVKSFTDLLKTDANAAILQFLEGLKSNGGFDALAPALKSLKMQGTQSIPVISSLINKMDELKEAQSVAKKAYDEGTSIVNEFNNANSSAAAKLDIARKALNDEAADLGKKLMPVVESSINASRTAISILSTLIDFTWQHRTTLLTLTATVAALTLAWKSHTVWMTLVDVKNKAVAASTVALTAVQNLMRTALVALRATWALLTKGIEGYNVVMRAARLASMTNPFTALATVLSVVGVAVYGLVKAWQSHKQAMLEQDPAFRAMKAHAKDMEDIGKQVNSSTAKEIATINHLSNVIHSNAFSVDERRTAIKKLQEIIPGYQASISNEGRLYEENTQKIKNYIAQLRNEARAKAYMNKLTQIEQESLDAEDKLRRKENNLRSVDAELARGRDTTYKSKIQSRSVGSAGATTYEVETNGKLLAKQEERAIQQNAVNEARREKNTIDLRRNALMKQMERDGISANAATQDNGNNPPAPNLPKPSTYESSGGTGGKGGSGGSSNADNDKTEKDKQLEQNRLYYDKAQADLKEQLANQRITEDQYHQESFLSEQKYLQGKSDILKKYGATDREAIEMQNEATDAITKEANYQRQQQQKQLNDALQAAEKEHGAQLIAIERANLNGEYATEAEYDEAKTQLELEYQRKRLQIVKSGGGDVESAQQAYNQAELNAIRDTQQRKLKEYEQGYQQITEREGALSSGDFQNLRNSTQQAYDQHLLSYEQYQKRMTEITEMESSQRTQIQQEALSAVEQLMQSSTALFSALQSRETAAVDAKYKKEIDRLKKHGKDTTKLEEKREEEKAEIQKKYAQKQFKLQVLQIIAATAQSVANVWKEWAAYPPVAAALTAAAVAQGAIQLATAKAQMDAAAGLYSGGYNDEVEGYTADGNPREQAGFIPVHKREFVANHKAVANPQLRPVLDVIDRHQRMGNVEMLNATRLLNEAYGPGRYSGGYTSGTADPMPAMGEQPTATSALDGGETMAILREIADNTADSITVRELRDRISREEQMERNARR